MNFDTMCAPKKLPKISKMAIFLLFTFGLELLWDFYDLLLRQNFKLFKKFYILAIFSFLSRYESHIFDRLFPQIIFPLVGIAMTGSIYICVAISVERYLGICRHDIQIPCKFRVYLLAVLITTLLVECPKFFEIVGNEDDKGRYSLK